jgi:hypothetical protein
MSPADNATGRNSSSFLLYIHTDLSSALRRRFKCRLACGRNASIILEAWHRAQHLRETGVPLPPLRYAIKDAIIYGQGSLLKPWHIVKGKSVLYCRTDSSIRHIILAISLFFFFSSPGLFLHHPQIASSIPLPSPSASP